MIYFRPLCEGDFPLLLDWLQRPHVKQWWDDGDNSPEKVAAHYGDAADGTSRFILELDAEAAGYFQYYRVDAATFGCDQFLARPQDLSKGLGTQSLLAFLEMIGAREAPGRFVVDPSPDNLRAIRCYENCGFVHDPAASTPRIYFMARDLTPSGATFRPELS